MLHKRINITISDEKKTITARDFNYTDYIHTYVHNTYDMTNTQTSVCMSSTSFEIHELLNMLVSLPCTDAARHLVCKHFKTAAGKLWQA